MTGKQASHLYTLNPFDHQWQLRDTLYPWDIGPYFDQ